MKEADPFEAAKGKWFAPLLRKIDNLESVLERQNLDYTVDDMPMWAVTIHLKAFGLFGKGLGIEDIRRRKRITAATVGKFIGSKVSISHWWMACATGWRQLPLEEKTNFLLYPGLEGLGEHMRGIGELASRACPKIESLRKKAFAAALQQSTTEQSLFFSGYGEGLSVRDQISAWQTGKARAKGDTYLQRQLMVFYVMLCWSEIEENRVRGGFPAIREGLEAFVLSVSKEIQVDEDNFRQMLFRAGMKELGKTGRPRKLGQSTT